MRRVLPRTLLRPLTHPLRPLIAPKRCQTTGSATTPTDSSRANTDSTTPSSSNKRSSKPPPTIELLLVQFAGPSHYTEPSTLPHSNASLIRTMPQEIAKRRKAHPPHPKLSVTPLSDPDLYDMDSKKRMPVEMEIEFDEWRSKGVFPGTETIARTHYLDTLRRWRSRIRGEITEMFNKNNQQWTNASKTYFFYKAAEERGVDLSHVEIWKDMTPWEAALSGEAHLEEGDIDPEKFEKAFPGKPIGDFGSKAQKDLVDVVNHERLAERLAKERTDMSRFQNRVVGYRIYLPNLIIRLVRNHTPEGQPYDPWMATFRIPTAMTKLDLRSYLKAVYNLDVTFIRTDVYWGKVIRDSRTGQKHRQRGSVKNYKRAVVGLTQPFHYPDDLEELRALGRATGKGDHYYENRLTTLDENFFIRQNKQAMQSALKHIYKRAVRYRDSGSGNMGVTIQNIMRRRKDREQYMAEEAAKYRAKATNKASGHRELD